MTEPTDAAVMQRTTERTPPSTPPLQSIVWPARFVALASIWGLSFVFIQVALGLWNGLGAHDVVGDLMCLGAAASYGIGFPYARRFLALTGDSPLALAAAQVSVGTVETGILALLFTSPPVSIRADALGAVF